MNPHFRPRRRSAWEYLHRAAPWASLGREGHYISPRLFPHGKGLPTTSRLCRSPMMSNCVSYHISLRHLLPALPVLDPSLLSLPIGGDLPCYPSLVCHLQLIPRRLTGAADHVNCIPDVCTQAQPINQADQGIKCTLDPAGVRQCNHAIVRIEEGSLVPSLLSTITPLLLSLYHNHQPALYHLIHHHIEYGGGERISLCYSTLSPKLLPVVSARHCYHRQPPLICLEEPMGPGAHTVTFQDIQAPEPIQCVIRLVQFQEDHLQDLLTQGR